MLYVPVAKSTRILPYYYEIASYTEWKNIIQITAIDMGLKNTLFDELLIYDGWLIGLGSLFVLYCILIYTNSIVLTISTVLANIFAIADAYFIYQFIYRLPYFPFMNVLAIIIIVGKFNHFFSKIIETRLYFRLALLTFWWNFHIIII